LLLALFAFVPVLSGCSSQRLPAEAATVLDKADEITLYSLNPDKKAKKEGEGLRGWEVLGQTTLTGEDKKAIVKALNKAIAASDGSVAGCFNPRHGIKATHGGKTVELVICFECLSISGWTDGEKFSVLTSRQAEEAFNKILTDKGVKLPKGRDE
jgi:hypothetical protein